MIAQLLGFKVKKVTKRQQSSNNVVSEQVKRILSGNDQKLITMVRG